MNRSTPRDLELVQPPLVAGLLGAPSVMSTNAREGTVEYEPKLCRVVGETVVFHMSTFHRILVFFFFRLFPTHATIGVARYGRNVRDWRGSFTEEISTTYIALI